MSSALRYVESHGATARFALIVQSEEEAADSVVAGGQVASMGGFTGRETVLSKSYLARLIQNGQARYFLLGGRTGFGTTGTNAGIATIESTCKVISTTTWSGTSGATFASCEGGLLRRGSALPITNTQLEGSSCSRKI